MRLRKGMHVRELTRRVGVPERTGRVVDIHGRTVEVVWDDGHRSSLAGGLLLPAPRKKD